MSTRRRGTWKKTGGPPFCQMFHWIMDTPAWRSLDPTARALYVELKRYYSGSNNGTIGLGCRQAAVALGVSAATTCRAFQRLVVAGFIEPTSPGRFGNGYHLVTEWLLTEAFDNRSGQPARKDFQQWPRPVAPVKPKIRKQVAKTEFTVAPVQPGGIGIPQNDPDSFTRATVNADFPETQLHQRNTLTSSHRPPRAGGRQCGQIKRPARCRPSPNPLKPF